MRTTADDLETAYTVDQLAEKWALAPGTIWRYVRSGELDAIRLGSGPRGRIRITRAAADDFADRMRKPATANAPKRRRPIAG